VGVNREVHADVVDLGQTTFGLTSGDVLEDKVVELVLQNPKLLHVGETGEEVRVIHQDELSGLLVNHHTRSRERSRGPFINPARERSKERLIHEQPRSVAIQIEHRQGFFLSGVFNSWGHLSSLHL